MEKKLAITEYINGESFFVGYVVINNEEMLKKMDFIIEPQFTVRQMSAKIGTPMKYPNEIQSFKLTRVEDTTPEIVNGIAKI